MFFGNNYDRITNFTLQDSKNKATFTPLLDTLIRVYLYGNYR